MKRVLFIFLVILFGQPLLWASTCDQVFTNQLELSQAHQLNSAIAKIIIQKNGDGPGFETRRALNMYVKMMPQKYQDQINVLLMKGGRYLDSGSGDGLALSHLKVFDDGNLIDAVGVTARMEGNPKDIEKPGLRFIADGRLLEEIPYTELGRFDLIVDNYGPYAYSAEPQAIFAKYLKLLSVGGFLFIQTGHRDRQLVEVPQKEFTATVPLENHLKETFAPLVQKQILKIETLESVGMTLGQSQYEPYRVLTVQLLKEIPSEILSKMRPLLLKELNPGNPPYKIFSQQ